jgi:hypothetical protein
MYRSLSLRVKESDRMGKKQDESFWSRAIRYRLGGQVHWIQAGKAWEDDETWRDGTLLAYDGETATVAFHSPFESGGDTDPDSEGTGAEFDGEFARAAFDLEEAAVENLPLGGQVWVTDRWNVLAFPDEKGNAFALRPEREMEGTLFARIGVSHLRFLLARAVEEPVEEQHDSDELAYGTVTGLDDVTRFSIIPMEDAVYAAEIIEIVNSCSTWGEVREMATAEHLDALLGRAGYGSVDEYIQDLSVGRPIPGAAEYGAEMFAELGHTEPPKDDEPFDPNDIEGYQTADFPPATEYIQEEFLPKDLADEFGFRFETTFNGTFLQLPPESGPPIVAAMEKLGYRCTERSDLFRTEIMRFDWMG